MKFFGIDIRRAALEQRAAGSIEDPRIPVSQTAQFMSFFGVGGGKLPAVTIERALKVPAVLAAVAFLSRTLAVLPLHAYERGDDGDTIMSGKTADAVHLDANDLMSSTSLRQYFWQQVFTGGRGLIFIERAGGEVVNLWPMDPRKVVVRRTGFRLTYRHDGKEYPAEDVIDVPFMLKADLLNHFSPIMLAAEAIQLALAMNEYGSNFFAGGGVPPLSLSGPLPEGSAALKRATTDVERAIKFSRENGSPVLPIPPGHELKPVGFDPAKGQMVEARLFQIQEIARAFQLPPAFLQDLSKGTFANVEQQDLHLVKHLIGQWAKLFEAEMSLKLFGRERRGRRVEHNLKGLMRGDFKSMIEATARAIQTSQLTPNEARALDNRPRHQNPAADELLVQGATVVLGQSPVRGIGDNGGPPLDKDGDSHDAAA